MKLFILMFCLSVSACGSKVENKVEGTGLTKAQMEGKEAIVQPYTEKMPPLVYDNAPASAPISSKNK